MRVDVVLSFSILISKGVQTNNQETRSIFTDGLPSNIFSIGAGSSYPFSEEMI